MNEEFKTTEVEEKEYLTTTEIKNNNWTDGDIKKYLTPDKIITIHTHGKAQKCKLYLKSKVDKISEKSFMQAKILKTIERRKKSATKLSGNAVKNILDKPYLMNSFINLDLVFDTTKIGFADSNIYIELTEIIRQKVIELISSDDNYAIKVANSVKFALNEELIIDFIKKENITDVHNDRQMRKLSYFILHEMSDFKQKILNLDYKDFKQDVRNVLFFIPKHYFKIENYFCIIRYPEVNIETKVRYKTLEIINKVYMLHLNKLLLSTI